MLYSRCVSLVFCSCIILIVTFAPSALALGTTWSAETEEMLAQIRNNPVEVLENLDSNATKRQTPEALATRYYLISQANGALALHEQALSAAETGLSLQLDTESSLYHYLRLAQAKALNGLGRSQAAVNQARASLQWARKNNDQRLINYAISVNGYLSITLTQYSEAQALFQEGYQRLETHLGMFSRADFASMLALVYLYIEEPEQAEKFYREAETWYREHDVKLELANTLFGLGKTTLATGSSEKGIALLEESARIALSIRDLQGAAFSYEAVASELIDLGRSDEAMSYLDEALVLFTQGANPFMQIKVLIEEAHIALQRVQPEIAQQFLDRASSLAVGDSFLPQRIAIADSRARAYASQGNHQSAYAVLLQNRQNRATLQKEINSRRILELQAQFDLEQQRAKNALLEEQNLRQQNQLINENRIQQFTIAVIALLFVVCLLLTWLYFNSKRQKHRLEQLANFDGLTGLMTRRKTMEDAEQQYQLAHRHGNHLTAAVIDLDFFKQINDKFGHQVGDDVLREFGDCAQKHFRKTDVLGRIGGEEFLFLFPHTDTEASIDMLKRFADKIRKLPSRLEIPSLSVTLSVGIVDAQHYRSLTQVIAEADEALYEAKRTGRDKIVAGKKANTETSS